MMQYNINPTVRQLVAIRGGCETAKLAGSLIFL